MRRALGISTPPGIAQATYDAVVAERDAALAAQAVAEAKLVPVSAWVDLTDAITTACAGAAAADPDSLKASLTVTTTTGTFDGATIPCNAYAWTTHTTTNDGHGETLNIDLGTIAALFPSYNPALHAIQIESDLVDTGTLNSARPLIAVLIAASGTLGAVAQGAGWEITSATSVAYLYSMSATARNAMGATNPTTLLSRGHTRYGRQGMSTTQRVDAFVPASTSINQAFSDAKLSETMGAATDKLILVLGQTSATQGAVSGVKKRTRVRLVTVANIELADLDLGCQA